MYLFGEKVDFKGPKDAQEAGIAAVYQHPTSYPHLTVAENIFMGHEIKKNHIIQWKAMNEEANKLLKQLNADFDSDVYKRQGYACGAVGEAVADLERAGKRHAVITGVVEGGDPDVQAEIEEMCIRDR